jgi:hypothetical protein
VLWERDLRFFDLGMPALLPLDRDPALVAPSLRSWVGAR